MHLSMDHDETNESLKDVSFALTLLLTDVFFFCPFASLVFSVSFSCFYSHFVIACHDQRQGKWPGSIVSSV